MISYQTQSGPGSFIESNLAALKSPSLLQEIAEKSMPNILFIFIESTSIDSNWLSPLWVSGELVNHMLHY